MLTRAALSSSGALRDKGAQVDDDGNNAKAITSLGRPASEIVRQGYLSKQGHIIRSIKERFFVLTRKHLSYYTGIHGKIKGKVPLSPSMRVNPTGSGNNNTPNANGYWEFEIYQPDISKDGKPYQMRMLARSEEDMWSWIHAIRKAAAPHVAPSAPSNAQLVPTAADSKANSISAARSAHSTHRLHPQTMHLQKAARILSASQWRVGQEGLGSLASSDSLTAAASEPAITRENLSSSSSTSSLSSAMSIKQRSKDSGTVIDHKKGIMLTDFTIQSHGSDRRECKGPNKDSHDEVLQKMDRILVHCASTNSIASTSSSSSLHRLSSNTSARSHSTASSTGPMLFSMPEGSTSSQFGLLRSVSISSVSSASTSTTISDQRQKQKMHIQQETTPYSLPSSPPKIPSLSRMRTAPAHLSGPSSQRDEINISADIDNFIENKQTGIRPRPANFAIPLSSLSEYFGNEKKGHLTGGGRLDARASGGNESTEHVSAEKQNLTLNALETADVSCADYHGSEHVLATLLLERAKHINDGSVRANKHIITLSSSANTQAEEEKSLNQSSTENETSFRENETCPHQGKTTEFSGTPISSVSGYIQDILAYLREGMINDQLSQPQVVLPMGERGSGKSHLIREILSRFQTDLSASNSTTPNETTYFFAPAFACDSPTANKTSTMRGLTEAFDVLQVFGGLRVLSTSPTSTSTPGEPNDETYYLSSRYALSVKLSIENHKKWLPSRPSSDERAEAAAELPKTNFYTSHVHFDGFLLEPVRVWPSIVQVSPWQVESANFDDTLPEDHATTLLTSSSNFEMFYLLLTACAFDSQLRTDLLMPEDLSQESLSSRVWFHSLSDMDKRWRTLSLEQSRRASPLTPSTVSVPSPTSRFQAMSRPLRDRKVSEIDFDTDEGLEAMHLDRQKDYSRFQALESNLKISCGMDRAKDQRELWKILSAILWLGELAIVTDTSMRSAIWKKVDQLLGACVSIHMDDDVLNVEKLAVGLYESIWSILLDRINDHCNTAIVGSGKQQRSEGDDDIKGGILLLVDGPGLPLFSVPEPSIDMIKESGDSQSRIKKQTMRVASSPLCELLCNTVAEQFREWAWKLSCELALDQICGDNISSIYPASSAAHFLHGRFTFRDLSLTLPVTNFGALPRLLALMSGIFSSWWHRQNQERSKKGRLVKSQQSNYESNTERSGDAIYQQPSSGYLKPGGILGSHKPQSSSAHTAKDEVRTGLRKQLDSALGHHPRYIACSDAEGIESKFVTDENVFIVKHSSAPVLYQLDDLSLLTSTNLVDDVIHSLSDSDYPIVQELVKPRLHSSQSMNGPQILLQDERPLLQRMQSFVTELLEKLLEAECRVAYCIRSEVASVITSGSISAVISAPSTNALTSYSESVAEEKTIATQLKSLGVLSCLKAWKTLYAFKISVERFLSWGRCLRFLSSMKQRNRLETYIVNPGSREREEASNQEEEELSEGTYMTESNKHDAGILLLCAAEHIRDQDPGLFLHLRHKRRANAPQLPFALRFSKAFEGRRRLEAEADIRSKEETDKEKDFDELFGLGNTFIYVRDRTTMSALVTARDRGMTVCSILIQKIGRGFLARKRVKEYQTKLLPAYRGRLIAFYQRYNPLNLRNVNTILTKFRGREDLLLERLYAKYGKHEKASLLYGKEVSGKCIEGYKISSPDSSDSFSLSDRRSEWFRELENDMREELCRWLKQTMAKGNTDREDILEMLSDEILRPFYSYKSVCDLITYMMAGAFTSLPDHLFVAPEVSLFVYELRTLACSSDTVPRSADHLDCRALCDWVSASVPLGAGLLAQFEKIPTLRKLLTNRKVHGALMEITATPTLLRVYLADKEVREFFSLIKSDYPTTFAISSRPKASVSISSVCSSVSSSSACAFGEEENEQQISPQFAASPSTDPNGLVSKNDSEFSTTVDKRNRRRTSSASSLREKRDLDESRRPRTRSGMGVGLGKHGRRSSKARLSNQNVVHSFPKRVSKSFCSSPSLSLASSHRCVLKRETPSIMRELSPELEDAIELCESALDEETWLLPENAEAFCIKLMTLSVDTALSEAMMTEDDIVQLIKKTKIVHAFEKICEDPICVAEILADDDETRMFFAKLLVLNSMLNEETLQV